MSATLRYDVGLSLWHAWGESGQEDAPRGPTLPRALFEKLCDVARRRDRAIKKAQTKRVTPAGAATRHFAGAVRVGPAGPTAAG